MLLLPLLPIISQALVEIMDLPLMPAPRQALVVVELQGGRRTWEYVALPPVQGLSRRKGMNVVLLAPLYRTEENGIHLGVSVQLPLGVGSVTLLLGPGVPVEGRSALLRKGALIRHGEGSKSHHQVRFPLLLGVSLCRKLVSSALRQLLPLSQQIVVQKPLFRMKRSMRYLVVSVWLSFEI